MTYLSDIDLILATANLHKTLAKLRNSLSEIETKHPGRTDLINSMKETISELSEVTITFRTLEMEARTYGKRNFDLELICLQKETELRELRAQNERLKEEIEKKF